MGVTIVGDDVEGRLEGYIRFSLTSAAEKVAKVHVFHLCGMVGVDDVPDPDAEACGCECRGGVKQGFGGLFGTLVGFVENCGSGE